MTSVSLTASQSRERMLRAPSRAILAATGLAVALVIVLAASTMLGQYSLAPADVAASLWNRLASVVVPGTVEATTADGVLWNVRIPRLIAAMVVGAALATAGAITQGLFGNPLAEPGVIGITAGAGVGAALAIVFAGTSVVGFVVPAAAFASGIVTTLIVLVCSSRLGGSATVGLVLVGIAVNAVAGAVSSLAIFFAETTSREAIVFWQMGSLNGATWSGLWPGAIVIGIGLAGAMALGSGLDRLVLGERGAAHLGLHVGRFRVAAVLCAAGLTAGAVAIGGLIGFLGLVVPHVLRLAIGPSHRLLLPLSALGGALLLSIADLGARTLVPFVDLPIGVLTALVGGPVFFALIRSKLRSQG